MLTIATCIRFGRGGGTSPFSIPGGRLSRLSRTGSICNPLPAALSARGPRTRIAALRVRFERRTFFKMLAPDGIFASFSPCLPLAYLRVSTGYARLTLRIGRTFQLTNVTGARAAILILCGLTFHAWGAEAIAGSVKTAQGGAVVHRG